MNRLEVDLPPYVTPRNVWREHIHASVSAAMATSHVEYHERDRLAVEVHLHMSNSMLRFHDVDNRLKDVLDALQGRVGGPKKVRKMRALVPNDKQIFEARVSKAPPPAGRSEGGRLVISLLPGHGAV
jgi:Holliday junction resolvase RusA-like endonuclease